MADTEHRPPADNPEVSHEHRDINVRAIVGFGLALLISAVIISLGLYWLLWHYERTAVRRAPEITPMDITRPMPPEPHLRVSPPADLAAMRAAEENMLQTYGWVDQERKIVRMPIDRAMELLAERGLPARKDEKK